MPQQKRRYFSSLVVSSIKSAFFSAGGYGVEGGTTGWFDRINEFVLLTTCTTIHVALLLYSQEPRGLNKAGEPVYGSIEPARIQPLLEKKKIQWSAQIPERRQAILEKVTRRVRADLPTFSTLFSTETLEIETGGWENTLDGLDVSSGAEEDNGANSQQGIPCPTAHCQRLALTTQQMTPIPTPPPPQRRQTLKQCGQTSRASMPAGRRSRRKLGAQLVRKRTSGCGGSLLLPENLAAKMRQCPVRGL